MGKIVNKIVNDTHEKASVNTCEFYPVANEDLGIRKGNTKIQGNTEENGNQYAGNESIGKSVLAHYISPEVNYSLVSMMAQDDALPSLFSNG